MKGSLRRAINKTHLSDEKERSKSQSPRGIGLIKGARGTRQFRTFLVRLKVKIKKNESWGRNEVPLKEPGGNNPRIIYRGDSTVRPIN